MKNVIKGVEPPSLDYYRPKRPQSTWEEMREDAFFRGKEAYAACRADAITQQGGLCAYCEADIADNHPQKCRVEHFHPKSDRSTAHNYALEWQNMLAVCSGGSNSRIADSDLYIEPHEKNRSCDSYKDTMIQKGILPENCEGYILNPILLSAFPTLFSIDKSTGELKPGAADVIEKIPLSLNNYQTITELVAQTIRYLNLNCDRLNKARLEVVRAIEKGKKNERDQGYSPEQGLDNLCRKHFQKQWKKFFTTRRICLQPVSENYLRRITTIP